MSTPARGLGGPGNGVPVRPYVWRGGKQDRPEPPPQLKGARKVTAFPGRPSQQSGDRYPFREIAEDGGVWKLDPAVYGVKASGARSAAKQWARKNGMRVETRIRGDAIYVQFRKQS